MPVPELDFQVVGVEAVVDAAAPTLAFELLVDHRDGDELIHNVMLQTQIRIEAVRREYEGGEQAALFDLFGEPERWGQTLRSLHWTNVSVMVPAFRRHTRVALHVPCTYDFNLAATRYFDGLSGGVVPLCLLFSGTVFYEGEGMPLQVGQISWEKQAECELPVKTWRQMMDRHYPGCSWLCLRKDIHDRLLRYKSRCSLPTLEQAMEQLLDEADAQVTR